MSRPRGSRHNSRAGHPARQVFVGERLIHDHDGGPAPPPGGDVSVGNAADPRTTGAPDTTYALRSDRRQAWTFCSSAGSCASQNLAMILSDDTGTIVRIGCFCVTEDCLRVSACNSRPALAWTSFGLLFAIGYQF